MQAFMRAICLICRAMPDTMRAPSRRASCCLLQCIKSLTHVCNRCGSKAQKVLNGSRYQCLLASPLTMDSRHYNAIVLCVYCRKKQAHVIPVGACGPICGNTSLAHPNDEPQGCWEKQEKEGRSWSLMNQIYFAECWKAKMAPMRKSTENFAFDKLGEYTCKIASYIFGFEVYTP